MIKNKDINSIFPITINIIMNILDAVSKLKKSIPLNPNKLEFTVFVIVSIDSLKEFSKLSPPAVSRLDRIKILIKKQIKIKKEEFKFSLLILCSVFKIFWSIIILGDTSLKISNTKDLKSIYIRKNLIPEEFDITEPPIIDKKIKNKKKFFGGVSSVKPELLMLLATLKNIFKNDISLMEKKSIKLKKNINNKIKKSSWCFFLVFILLKRL